MATSLLFDFDGTIADSFPLIVDLFYELTEQQPIVDEQRINRLRQLPFRKVVKELDVPFHRVPGLIVRGKSLMQRRIGEVKPFPQIEQVLRDLRADGHRLFILSSNSEENIRKFLRKEKIEDYFEDVQGGASLLAKAHAIKKIMHKNELDPKDCVYIGDEVRDITAAKKAGVRVVSVAWGFNDRKALAKHKPFALVYRPTELIELFRKLTV